MRLTFADDPEAVRSESATIALVRNHNTAREVSDGVAQRRECCVATGAVDDEVIRERSALRRQH